MNGAGGDALIYGVLRSTWTRTAVLVCHFKQVPYQLIPPPGYGTPEHLQLHPFGRIPAVEIDGHVLFEALAIGDYIDAVGTGPSLTPKDPRSLALMRSWQSLCADYVFRPVVRGIPRDRDPYPDERAAARAALTLVDARIQATPFLCGTQLTLADLWLAPQIDNAAEKQPAILAGLQAIAHWRAMLEDRAGITAGLG